MLNVVLRSPFLITITPEHNQEHQRCTNQVTTAVQRKQNSGPWLKEILLLPKTTRSQNYGKPPHMISSGGLVFFKIGVNQDVWDINFNSFSITVT